MKELPPLDFRKMKAHAVYSLVKRQLTPEGLLRLAELEAAARPVSRRIRINDAKDAVRAMRRASRLFAKLGWTVLLPVSVWSAGVAAEVLKGERGKEAPPPPDGGPTLFG